MKQAYIALGSNMGNRAENLNKAVWAVSLLPDTVVTAVSKIYETEPVGYKKQDNFYNAVIRVETKLSPRALLGACLGIEAAMGRLRSIKNGPRVMDLDLLLYEGEEMDEPELTLPHPRMEERSFVLSPLCDIMPDKRYLSLLKELGRDGVKVASEQIIKP